jgi:hypothetical protein
VATVATKRSSVATDSKSTAATAAKARTVIIIIKAIIITSFIEKMANFKSNLKVSFERLGFHEQFGKARRSRRSEAAVDAEIVVESAGEIG